MLFLPGNSGTCFLDKRWVLVLILTVLKAFSEVISGLISRKEIIKIDLAAQFRKPSTGKWDALRRLNAAFLISLAGRGHLLYSEAREYLSRAAESAPDKDMKEAAGFLLQAIEETGREIEKILSKDENFPGRLQSLAGRLKSYRPAGHPEVIKGIREVFFPEGAGLYDAREEIIPALRKRRVVRIEKPNPEPLQEPAEEIIFTANALLTVPPPERALEACGLEDELACEVEDVMKEEQLYWYDHPVQIGVDPERNEVLYGLSGLSETLRFEKKRGVVPENSRLTVILSVSVTHRGLHRCSKAYLEHEIRKHKDIQGLDVYIFTEADTVRMVEEVLYPAGREFFSLSDGEMIEDVFGVDGEYGRHYSFLKAVTAFWQVFIDPRKRATFKIDLDQVFPEETLVRETGCSAFEHLKTPLWGAEGIDSEGRPVRLGMLAGALVNESDIQRSLFTPDVGFPEDEGAADEVIFHSRFPQAVSTVAEMMTRYDGSDDLDGKSSCLQRVHVTGGTTGILIRDLRAYRPFSPSFIGRAEDQAYIMSVLYQNNGPFLRYLHKAGLIMRHDKEAFAEEAIRQAAQGKAIGDILRMLLFSLYAGALPWRIKEIKDFLDPFSGCFISDIPFTMAFLRLALKGAYLFDRDEDEALEFLRIGIRRIGKLLAMLRENSLLIKERFDYEKQAWGVYYETLTGVEEALRRDDPFAKQLKERAERIIEEVVIRT